MNPSPDFAFAEIAARLGGQLRRYWRLTGGVSALVTALELALPNDSLEVVVVRQPHAVHHKVFSAEAAAAEYQLLCALHAANLPVARPRLLDVSHAVLDTPYLVTDFIEGTSDIMPAALPAVLDTMAAFLAHLHALDSTTLPTLPRSDDPVPGLLKYLPHMPALEPLRAQLEAWQTRAAPATRTLLHGDFWPGNILWQGTTIAAVLDWDGAAIGDPLADLAGARVELLWRYDAAAATQLTTCYQRHSRCQIDDARLALWEIYAAAAGLAFMGGWHLTSSVEAEMRAKTLDFLPHAAHRALLVR